MLLGVMAFLVVTACTDDEPDTRGQGVAAQPSATSADENLTEPEQRARTMVFNEPTRAACAHIEQAVAAQARHDWKADVAALHAAWAAGQAEPGHNLGRDLDDWATTEGDKEALEDTQSLNEINDRLAILCHIPLA
jgi:hypothetical protein